MANELEHITCPFCGSVVLKVKFCSECGSKLEGAKPAKTANEKMESSFQNSGNPMPFQPVEPVRPQRKALSDEGLTMLVNTCKKTIATVGGDGYSEIVLYLDEATGKYWLHTYSKYVYMPEEAHASYIAAPELAETVLAYIEEHKLASWKDNRFGPPMCGGDYVIRFKHGEQIIRLDSGTMMDGLRAYSDISDMLYAGATEENRRYADD